MESSLRIITDARFINNLFQAYDDMDDNSWNDTYPSGGNYWSDYEGLDLNSTPSQDVPPSDGIGDTPYNIDADSTDYYPLMIPYDPYPPIIHLLSPVNNSIIQAGVILDFNVIDDYLDSVNYSLNGVGDYTLSSTFNISTTGWPDNDYIVQIYAKNITLLF